MGRLWLTRQLLTQLWRKEKPQKEKQRRQRQPQRQTPEPLLMVKQRPNQQPNQQQKRQQSLLRHLQHHSTMDATHRNTRISNYKRIEKQHTSFVTKTLVYSEILPSPSYATTTVIFLIDM